MSKLVPNHRDRLTLLDKRRIRLSEFKGEKEWDRIAKECHESNLLSMEGIKIALKNAEVIYDMMSANKEAIIRNGGEQILDTLREIHIQLLRVEIAQMSNKKRYNFLDAGIDLKEYCKSMSRVENEVDEDISRLNFRKDLGAYYDFIIARILEKEDPFYKMGFSNYSEESTDNGFEGILGNLIEISTCTKAIFEAREILLPVKELADSMISSAILGKEYHAAMIMLTQAIINLLKAANPVAATDMAIISRLSSDLVDMKVLYKLNKAN